MQVYLHSPGTANVVENSPFGGIRLEPNAAAPEGTPLDNLNDLPPSAETMGEYSAKKLATIIHEGDYKRSKLEILFTSVRQASSPFSVISTVRLGEPLPPRDFALLIITYPKASSLFRWFSKLPFPSPVSVLSSTELIFRACASNTSIRIRVDDLRAESPSCSFSDLIVSSVGNLIKISFADFVVTQAQCAPPRIREWAWYARRLRRRSKRG